MSGLHIFVSAALLLSAFKDLSRLYTSDFLTPFYNSLFIYYMSHKLFYKPSANYAHCGYGHHKQKLIFHCRETVLEEHPGFMAWLVLSAAYRVLFRDLIYSLGVGGEENIKSGKK